MPGKIQLVLPGLFDLPLAELEPDLIDNGLPHLNRILRLATARPNQAYNIDSILQTALSGDGCAQKILTGLPLAQAFVRAGEVNANRLLLFQAIHLRADLHSAVIIPIKKNEKNLNDITLIIKDLKNLFKVDCDIIDDSGGLYVMRLNEIEAPSHYPHIFSVLGKSVSPYIEQSRQILPWYKLLNEIQMFMHQHEVNQQRLQRGSLPVNSLWAWGGGALPHALPAALDWYCDDPVLNRFALSLALKPRACADIGGADFNSDGIVVDLRLMEWLKTGLDAELEALLLEIDQVLLGPMLTAVFSGKSSLVLRAGFDIDFELRPVARFKFWRRRRDLGAWNSHGEAP